MAVTIKQTEALPDAYPDLGSPSPLSAAAAALDPAMVWQRIESYVAHRWSERAVTWIVEGPGEWVPPLAPATITTVEVWSGADAWEDVTANASPLGGHWLSATGPYRFSGTAGDDGAEVPAAVLEAYRRLAEYMAGETGKPGARSESLSIGGGDIAVSLERSPAWLAMALQNSGAADLLRPYRRA